MAKIIGTHADDTLSGTDEGDRIWSLGGNDVVNGGAGDDFVDGGAGNDVLTSSSGFDELTGSDGDDRFIFNGVGGAARGGTGIDTLVGDYSARSDAFLFNGFDGHAALGDPTAEGYHLYFIDIERLNLTTGSGDDRIIATGFSLINVHTGSGDDVVEGGLGGDQMVAGDGRDTLVGGGGNDFLRGGLGGDDINGGNDNDEILGEEGNDSLVGGRGEDRMDGGDGDDSLNGGDGNDRLSGGAGEDTLIGGAGNDYLRNYLSDGDILIGGDGNDFLSAGEEDLAYSGGRFQLYGGAGDDGFHIYSDGSIGTLDGGEGFDRADIDFDDVAVAFAFDASRHASIEAFDVSVRSAYRGVHIYGGGGDDTLISYDTYREGPSGSDVLNGRGGDDVLFGGSGADSLIGGDGNDTLRGDFGADRLLGGAGSDLLTGGTGADTFIWDEGSLRNDGNADRITDFNTGGGDVLLFRGFGDTGIQDFQSFVAASRDTPEGIYVSFDRHSNGLLIEDTMLANLSRDDIAFA
ncbi:calcium-binding protein [Sinorhizobium meliloti]|uniref:calcium-binding protein n=1 Tax=Rhizobium meliloti TaxID=382 RepID=UPI000B4994F8|nr:calcium-binding protein [Sinorhizobium meliloti]ASP93653.1 hemolysin-type calcium-binding protein [Sinorhizobium meliloti]MQX56509.1 calcium-binding protein [Sinorhizobium meliloti]